MPFSASLPLVAREETFAGAAARRRVVTAANMFLFLLASRSASAKA